MANLYLLFSFYFLANPIALEKVKVDERVEAGKIFEIEVVFPESPGELSPVENPIQGFLVKSLKQKKLKNKKTSLKLSLVQYRTGSFEIPLDQLLKTSSQNPIILKGPLPRVLVFTKNPPPDQPDLAVAFERVSKGSSGPNKVALWLGGFCLLSGFVFWVLKKSKRKRSPLKDLQKAIGSLDPKVFEENKNPSGFYIEIKGAVLTFLIHKFPSLSKASSTQEVMTVLSEGKDSHYQGLMSLLIRADQVRFALETPGVDELEQDKRALLTLLQKEKIK